MDMVEENIVFTSSATDRKHRIRIRTKGLAIYLICLPVERNPTLQILDITAGITETMDIIMDIMVIHMQPMIGILETMDTLTVIMVIRIQPMVGIMETMVTTMEENRSWFT
jgi:hypothetical protein